MAMTKSNELTCNLFNMSLSPFDNVIVLRVTLLRGGTVGVNDEVAGLIRSTSNIQVRFGQTHMAYARR